MPDSYSAESIPGGIITDLMTAQWDEKTNGEIPSPTVVDVNNGEEGIRIDVRKAPYIVVRTDTPGEEERPIGSWVYGHRTTRVLLELYTMKDRQHLYDMKQEVRRICHSSMHTVNGYQRIQYVSFNEVTQEQQNIWVGRVIIELVNNAVLLET